jgi:glycopeptide antibiotics resistance protein
VTGTNPTPPNSTGVPRPSLLRRWALRLTVVYLVALALIAFWPTPVDRDAHDSLLAVLDWLQEHGAPGWLGYSLVEFTANILLFVPVGLLAVILAGPRRWYLGVLAGFVASCTIELGQLLFLPDRFATLADVVANTGGATIGTALALMLLSRAAPAHPEARGRDAARG